MGWQGGARVLKRAHFAEGGQQNWYCFQWGAAQIIDQDNRAGALAKGCHELSLQLPPQIRVARIPGPCLSITAHPVYPSLTHDQRFPTLWAH